MRSVSGGWYISCMLTSSLGTYRNCPRKFKFEKIDKVAIPKRLLAYNHLGNVVHRQLTTAYQWAADGKQYDLAAMLSGFEAEWDTPIREKVVPGSDHLTVDDYIDAGRRMLTRYYERYQPFDQGILLGAERNLSFELTGCPGTFTARIDRLWKREDGVVEVCDYKTGRSLARGVTDPSFRLQMGMYQLAVQYIYPQYQEIELAQYFLRHDEVIRCRMRPDELDELAEQFRSEVHEIACSNRLDDFPTRESGLCRFCDYAHLCPAKRHRLALEAEEKHEEWTTVEQAAELADQYIRLDVEKRKLTAEQEALKRELIQAAKVLKTSKLYGTDGYVTISIRHTEELPTKKTDEHRLAELSSLVRSWGDEMETCFKLDGAALMKTYRKGRLSEEQVGELRKYLTPTEKPRVTPKAYEPDNSDETR